MARRTFVDQNTLKMQFQEALDPATRCENPVAPSPVTSSQLVTVPYFSAVLPSLHQATGRSSVITAEGKLRAGAKELVAPGLGPKLLGRLPLGP